MAIPTFTLNNGVEIPALGFGTFAAEGTASKGTIQKAVFTALETGYRHLDYEVGAGLWEFLSTHPDVKRDDVFVTTKVWPHLFEPEDTEWSLNNSLENLHLDYVDCFLLHWPFAAEKTENHEIKRNPDGKYIINKALTDNHKPVWKTMEKLYKEGKARSIGVSNFKIEHLEAILKYAEIRPAINQVEIHPLLPNTELLEFCWSHDILPAAYSPLGSQEKAPEKVMENAELQDIAAKKNVDLAQLLITWGIKRGYVVLPKSATESRIKSNFQLLDLSDEEFEAVHEVAKGRHTRFVNPVDMFGYKVWPEES